MATTVDAAFNQLIAAISSTASISQTTRTHRDEISSRLAKEFGSVVDFPAIGSFGNGTNVKGFSDADYLAWLPILALPDNSATLLTRVRSTLSLRFPLTEVKVRTPTVAVCFANDKERIEVVPARFGRKLEGVTVYEIADGDGGWMETAPAIHNAYVQRHHSRLSSRLKPLIRLMKYWNFVHNLRLPSFYIEMRVTKYAEDTSVILHSWDVRDALKYLAKTELRSMHDPVLSGYVRTCPNSYRTRALTITEKSAEAATLAREAEQKGQIRLAFTHWNTVFANRFPSYG